MPPPCKYCQPEDLSESYRWIIACHCNEDPGASIEWKWNDFECSNTVLSEDDKVVLFHPIMSEGTAITRGSRLLTTGFHHWEMKLLSPAYGTDIMVGICTPEMDIMKYRTTYNSALGKDNLSWGLSYRGIMKHNRLFTRVPGGVFKRGDIVSCFLDMWHRTLTYFVNRKPVTDKKFYIPEGNYYPFISSTAARSGFRLIYAKSYPISLQILACMSLKDALSNPSIIFDLPGFPPGLQTSLLNNLPWLFFSGQRPKDAEEKEQDTSFQSSSSTSLPPSLNPRRSLFDEISSEASLPIKRHKPDIVNPPLTANQVLENLFRMSGTSSPTTSYLEPSSTSLIPKEPSAHNRES